MILFFIVRQNQSKNVSHGETHLYITPPQTLIPAEKRCAMYFILPMAIIGRLKVSCRTGPEATTMTAAWTGRTQSAGNISHTAEIGSAGTKNAPSPRGAVRQERGREKALRPRREKA